MRNQYTSILIITLYSLLFNFSSIADQKEKSRQSYKQATEELPGAIKELTDIISKENQARRGLSANNLVELNNMRATVAFKQKPDGSFCSLDVRGNSKLTPSFVQSAHRKASSPKSSAPICSESEKKDFQKTTKKLNLKGAKAQKTIAAMISGAIVGGLASCILVGPSVALGNWAINKLGLRVEIRKDEFKIKTGEENNTKIKGEEGHKFNIGSKIGGLANDIVDKVDDTVDDIVGNDSNDQKTEAQAPCIDCTNKKRTEEENLDTFRTVVAAILGGVVGIRTRTLTGVVAGISGAIFCENGVTYLLTKEKIEDI